MLKIIKRALIGKPLKNEALKNEKLGVLWGLPILSSDAISSIAYAGQEMLMVLIPAAGIAAYAKMSVLSWCIIALLVILMLSYRQTIDSYPNGGGAFIVAKENLGPIPGMVAGSALAINYILTVAVSISAGVDQLISAFDSLAPYNVLIAVILVLFLMVGNLRGVRESSRLFGVPAYAFILGMIALMVCGAVKLMSGYTPPEPDFVKPMHAITLLVMLKAFACGCTALTGVEAVSNAVPDFKKTIDQARQDRAFDLILHHSGAVQRNLAARELLSCDSKRGRSIADPAGRTDLRPYFYVLLYNRYNVYYTDPRREYRLFRVPDAYRGDV